MYLELLGVLCLFHLGATQSAITTAPEPQSHTFEVKDISKKACIIMQTGMQVRANYTTKNKTVALAELNTGSKFNVTGQCGDKNNPAILILSFDVANSALTVKFNFSIHGDSMVHLDHETVTGIISAKDFPDMLAGVKCASPSPPPPQPAPEPKSHTFEVQHMSNKTTYACIIIQTGMQVRANYTTRNQTVGLAALNTGSRFHVTGQCGDKNNPAILILSFDVANSALTVKFNFSIHGDNMVHLDHETVTGTISAKDFPDMLADLELNSENNLNFPLAPPDQYWECGHDTDDPITADISLHFIAFKVQAFVTDGKFSDKGIKCASPPPPPPQPAPEPKSHTFEVQDTSNKTCIIIQTGMQVRANYTTKNQTVGLAALNTGSRFNVTGQCGDKNSPAILILSFDVANSAVAVKFNFSIHGDNMVHLDHETVTGTISAKDFPDMLADLELNSENNLNFPLAPPDQYWECGHDTDDPVTANISLHFIAFKVQAFVKDGKFSDNGVKCASPPPPPPSPAHPTMTYMVKNADNKTCITFKAGIQLTIPYESNTTNSSKTFSLPNTTTVDTKVSACDVRNDSTTEILKLDFFNGKWSILFVFTKSNHGNSSDAGLMAATGDSFSITHVNVTYMLDKEHFPDLKNGTEGQKEVHSSLNNTFVAKVGGSYRCSSDSVISLEKGLTLETFDLQYTAFDNSTSGGFSPNNVVDCNSSGKGSGRDSIVPIVVGAALGGLVLVVLIVYFVGMRRRNRNPYGSF